MQTITASQAKQNFGALLSQLAHSPVAIARHNKTVAVVMLPAAAARPCPTRGCKPVQNNNNVNSSA